MRVAIVTASYRGDFERCRLLCDSIDARVEGQTRHLILVENRDVPLFRALAGPRREIVAEGDLFPAWLRPFPDPFTLGRRRVWLSPKGPPLRGWHAQQLRRIAIAARLEEEVMVSCDSDVVFVRPFAVAAVLAGEAVAFYREPDGLARLSGETLAEHRRWTLKADALLGIPPGAPTDAGYIDTAIAWRTDTARDMTARIEATAGRPLIAALAATRALSECTIYGRFVDAVEARPERHAPTSRRICRVYWSGAALEAEALAAFIAGMEPDQAAVGIQSFTGTDLGLIRRAAGLA